MFGKIILGYSLNSLLTIALLLIGKCMMAQGDIVYYELLDSTHYSAPAATIVKVQGNEIECYTYPKKWNMGLITAHKGHLNATGDLVTMHIDTSWSWSANTGYCREIRIGCAPKIDLIFSKDSSTLTLKVPQNQPDISRYLSIFIEPEIGETYNKVKHPKYDWDWNCGSYKNWKRRIDKISITNCN